MGFQSRLEVVDSCSILVEPAAQPLPGGIILVPSLMSGDQNCRCIRLVSLSAGDTILYLGRKSLYCLTKEGWKQTKASDSRLVRMSKL